MNKNGTWDGSVFKKINLGGRDFEKITFNRWK